MKSWGAESEMDAVPLFVFGDSRTVFLYHKYSIFIRICYQKA
jgi:hypothetical protein